MLWHRLALFALSSHFFCVIPDYGDFQDGFLHFEMLIEALAYLMNGEKLPEKFKDHQLSGRLAPYRELHIGGDMLVMYAIEDDIIYLLRLGTHAEILGM